MAAVVRSMWQQKGLTNFLRYARDEGYLTCLGDGNLLQTNIHNIGATLVGVDNFGNKCDEKLHDTQYGRHRWVEYADKGRYNASSSVIERNVVRPLMRLVTMGCAPILQQLHLEERLLRRSSDNWCIVNDGTTPPTIVMGVSGSVSELIEIQPVLRDHVPVVRRFTGGGTVIVDQGTVFVTFICNKNAVDGLKPFPRDIMLWTGQLYDKVFSKFGEFHLRENDYAFSHRKFGGNAQSITKDRWVHHTSFLWDYDAKNMHYLKIPKRAPEYRLARNHSDFLCRMSEYIPSRSVFTKGIIAALSDHFTVQPTELETTPSDDKDFVPSTKLLSPQDLEDNISSKESPAVQKVVAWPQL